VLRTSSWRWIDAVSGRWFAALLLGAMLLAIPAGAALADDREEARSLLARGWTFMEAGDMNKADDAFNAAFKNTEVGRNSAETYYAIAAIWWERRNAMAAYMWLSDGVKAARESYSWDGGPSQEWDRRIGGRKRFIENNFTVAKLRAVRRGKSLPPLADPPPIDPVLREFAERLPRLVEDGDAAKVELQWVLLPNGSYWVGNDLQRLSGGELEPSRAVSWDLVKDSRHNRRRYNGQVAAIEAGQSMALKLLKQGDLLATEVGRKEAAEAAAIEERDRQSIVREARRREAEKEFQRRALEEEHRKKTALEEAARRELSRQSAEGGAAEAPVTEPATEPAAQAAAAPAEEAQAPPAPAQEADPPPVASTADTADTSQAADPGPQDRKERDDGQWAEAMQKRAEVQAEENRQVDESRKSVKKQKSRLGKTPPDQDAYLARRFYVAVGGGGSSVTRLTSTSTEAEMQWQGHWEFGYVAPLTVTPVGPLGIALAVSYNNLPVSGCSQQQTRGNALALHAAPRLGMFLTGRLWLQAQVGFHLGGLGTWPTEGQRDSCAQKRLQTPDDQVAYGARLGSEGAFARLSFEELGWRGYAVVLGPDLAVGISVAPRAARLYLGAQFFLRHDQVFAVLNEGTYRYRVEGQDGLALGQQRLDAISGTASMARFQFGLRGHISF